MSPFQFVDNHCETNTVKKLRHVLGLHRSSFYKWRASESVRRQSQHADETLVTRIRDYPDDFDATIGVRRITAEINDRTDDPVNHQRIERLMRQHQKVGVNLLKKKRITIPDRDARVFNDLVGRDFTADDCNQIYIGDITYLPCGGGDFMYLAAVIDVHSRRLVSYWIADHMRTGLVQEALEDAARTRGPLGGAVCHNDHGSVYASSAFHTTCRRLGIRRPMGRSGPSADNVMAESFSASLKRETPQGSGGTEGIGHLSPRAFEDRATDASVAFAA